MADNGNDGARGGGGPFRFSKKRAVKSLFEGVVLMFGDLVASQLVCLKRTGPSVPAKSNQ